MAQIENLLNDLFSWLLNSIVFLLPLIPLGIFVLFSVNKWQRIRSTIFDESKNGPDKKGEDKLSQTLSFERWQDRFQVSYQSLLSNVEEDDYIVQHSDTQTVSELYGIGETLAKKSYELAHKVRETGELQSLLLKIDDLFAYILFFPAMHDQPTMLKRYATFSQGWINHVNSIHQAISSDHEPQLLIEVALFLNPNLRQGNMYLALQNGEYRLLPVNLLDGAEIKNAPGSLSEFRQVI